MNRTADILVLSDAADVTAAEVVSWLRARGRSARWVHSEDPVVGLRLELSEGGSRSQLVFERAQGLDLGEIGAVWHRQSAFHFRLPPGLSPGLAALLTADIASAREGLMAALRAVPSLGLLPPEGVSQLRQLRVARQLGVPVPETLLTTSRSGIEEFAARHGAIITKRIDAPPTFTEGGQRFAAGGTRLLRPEELGELDAQFTPALVQALVPKAFELRVFYLQGDFFAMALLPTPGEPSAVDVREADAAGAMRRSPYTLPDAEASRLRALMRALGLDTGSLDLIVTPDERHVFLEVNPQGQLDWLSHDCNYHLEERIADALIALADGGAR